VTAELEGKVVAVTGAASGIGRATAMLAARSGARGLVLADLAADGLSDAAAEVAAAGALVETVTGSVADVATAGAIVARAVDRFGSLDAAVNAAGTMGQAAELTDYPDDTFKMVFDVNVHGVFGCLRAQLRQMYRQGSGCVVNIASASVFGVHAELGPYVASKAAVVAMTKVAAKEAGRRGVRVNAVCPGLTDTAMLRESMQVRPATSDIAAAIPLGRVGRPDEIAQAIVWLWSDAASFANGAVLVVDGGRSG
jgi:NAD(P)-dependent dehydrogenase (short-subunit alcohol dehydrogenase family)